MNAVSPSHAAPAVDPPRFPGGLPWIGHMLDFARNPYQFVSKVATTTGEIGTFLLFGQRIVLLTGDEASEVFYRSSDEQLDQAEAYRLMTPIFGEGVVFDAPIERKNEQLRMIMPTLRLEAMREHSQKIVDEVTDIIRDWGEEGEIKLVDFMKKLTINTASHCLLGREFRYELNDEFAGIYHDLEQAVSPLAYHFPYLPIAKFRRRDRARRRLQTLVEGIVRKRESQAAKPGDMFQHLIDMRYQDGSRLTHNEVTGMLISSIFAGHHTSSGTAAWVLLELLKNPPIMRQTCAELDGLLGNDGAVTFQALREMPMLENVLKEVLRLHPPLIILMRKVSQDLRFKNYTIKAGDMVWASPPVTHRLSRLFSNPGAFEPDRFSPERHEDKNLMAYQPFGGGKHKCSGNAFATFQIKAIFAVLLRRYEFELAAPPETYVDDYTQMIVQPKSPCIVRYRRRQARPAAEQRAGKETAAEAKCPVHAAPDETSEAAATFRIVVDRVLCQGHAQCTGEAPEHFHILANGDMEVRKSEVAEADRRQVVQAVSFCPNQALKLVRH